MDEIEAELKKRLVKGRARDGRCRYDKQAKRELVEACLKPGRSVARMAYEHGINANLLRKWISQHEQAARVTGSSAPRPPFIPVVTINANATQLNEPASAAGAVATVTGTISAPAGTPAQRR